MTQERTNTNAYELKPAGSYTLEIIRVIKKSIGPKEGRQYPGYEWAFDIRQSSVDLDDNNFKHFMFKSQMAELLRVLGAEEITPGEFQWNMEAVKGKIIDCELIHQDINGKLREGLINIKINQNFMPMPTSDDPKAWDE